MGRRIRVAAAAAACALLVAGATLAATRVHTRSAAATIDTSFRAAALDSRLHFLVHLPAGYSTSGLRYPVVYFLHGLPAGPTAYRSVAWVANAVDASGRRAIVVIPQGAQKPDGDPEYHDWGPGRNWETALAVELPRYVDAHYRTIRSRYGRAIVGLSAGGYGATVLGLHHLDEFAAIESWSGYFRPTDPTGETTLDVGSDADNAYASVHSLVPTLAKELRRYPTFIAFYVGAQDPTFVQDNLQLNRELTRARVWHLFDVYPGAHSNSLWQPHAPHWFGMALGHLRRPS